MRRRTFGVLGLAAAALALAAAGCGGGYGGGGGGGSTTNASAATSGAATVAGTKSDLGTILTANGRTLYLFEKDTSDKSECSGACAQAWPPLTTSGKPQAGSGVDASMLGTSMRSDGKEQVTYNGHPLYFYVKDTAAGDTNGQAVDAFGAEWYVMSPSGEKIEKSKKSGGGGGGYGY